MTRSLYGKFDRSGPLQIVSGQTTSSATLSACAASASVSARSPVTTVPSRSAIATTRALTAEPARARRLNSAARCTVDSLTDGSRRGSPSGDSARTIVGTTGGHSSCAVNARMSETAVLVRAERRDNAPLSRTSTGQPTRSSDRSRIHRAIASAVFCWRRLGSPTAATSSSRERSASASATWRSSSARSATCRSSDAGRSRTHPDGPQRVERRRRRQPTGRPRLLAQRSASPGRLGAIRNPVMWIARPFGSFGVNANTVDTVADVST